MTQLYEKKMIGKKTTYIPYVEPSLILSDDMTEEQLVSCIGGIAILAIHGYQNLVPEHKRVAKKVQKVKDSVLAMYQDCGAHIDQDHIDFVCAAWDGTMKKLAGQS
jgi:hypothetical protein